METFGETVTLTTNQAAVAGGMMGGMFAFFMTAGIIYWILLVVAGWEMFKKAGEKGWKVLIPIYDSYIFFKIVGMKNWFWAVFIVSFAISLITSLLGQGTQVNTIDMSTGTGVFSFILTLGMTIFALAVNILYSIRTSKAFGHGAGYAVGLFFLSGIFMLILGFGKSKYDKKLVASWAKK